MASTCVSFQKILFFFLLESASVRTLSRQVLPCSTDWSINSLWPGHRQCQRTEKLHDDVIKSPSDVTGIPPPHPTPAGFTLLGAFM